MRCTEVRDRLVGGERASAAAHLQGCAKCAAFARRLEEVAHGLREHHSAVAPPPAFAARVLGSLPGSPQVLGWAALRMLPATLALALVLLGWALASTPAPSSLVEQVPSDDLLSWTYDSEGWDS